jgi:hypothetical protein
MMMTAGPSSSFTSAQSMSRESVQRFCGNDMRKQEAKAWQANLKHRDTL